MNRASAASRCAGLSTVTAVAVGTPAAAITSLAKLFEPSIRAAAALGPEAGDARGAHGVGGAGDQRHLGPDDDQIGAPAEGQLGDRGRLRDVDPALLGERAGAGVARRAAQRGHFGILRQGEDDGVFTSSGADDQDAHGGPA